MIKASIIVVGGSSTGMVVKTVRLPQYDETVLGGSFFINAGRKGANRQLLRPD